MPLHPHKFSKVGPYARSKACERSVSGGKPISVIPARRSATSRSALCSAPSFFCNACSPIRSTRFSARFAPFSAPLTCSDHKQTATSLESEYVIKRRPNVLCDNRLVGCWCDGVPPKCYYDALSRQHLTYGASRWSPGNCSHSECILILGGPTMTSSAQLPLASFYQCLQYVILQCLCLSFVNVKSCIGAIKYC